ncbi:helix-turn-helix domain-containing protein [Streptomyces sp. NPDC002328]|uniref:helix-turn-helix domain-containing protein n=1 Tax=Streptomyces sp. NPDC002328 TaxID=3364642 RepID=UPI00369963D3
MDAIHDDIAEFALLLTRLKKRTDRSYAALARRLDMTASTLHRYCIGEAVPQDFAGIERFAALCGASPEERTELHRRWILAAAARQRPRPSDTRRTPSPDAPTSPPAPAASPIPSTPAAEPPKPTPQSAPGLGPASPATPDAGPASPATSRPGPVSPAAPDPGPGPASPATRRPGPASPSGPSPRPGRPRRPLRAVVVAASLAFAFVGLTASAAGPPADGGGSSASVRTAARPSASAAHGGGVPQKSRAGAGVPSPSASARTTAPSPSASAAHDGDGPRENRASDGAAPLATPLTWTADSHVWAELECEHDYVIDKPPQQVPPPPHPADAEPWAASQGAVHGRNTQVRITVQGRGSAAVVLEALHVRVADRTVPHVRRGIDYSTAGGCGATLAPRHFSVNLDARRPLPRVVPAGRPDSPSFAVDFPYRVSLEEPEVLLVSAGTESCTCDWYLDLDWSSQGRRGTVRIDDHGRPFRTTSIEGLPHYWYRSPAGWVPIPEPKVEPDPEAEAEAEAGADADAETGD